MDKFNLTYSLNTVYEIVFLMLFSTLGMKKMSILDVGRGVYVKLPPKIRLVFSHAIRFVPLKYRFGQTFQNYKKLVERADVDSDFVIKFQRDNLLKVATSALKTSHYKAIFREKFGAQFSPEEFTLKNLMKLPVLTKEILKQDPLSLLSVDISEVDEATTSGSSGTPLRFFLDKNRSVKQWAFQMYGWGKSGFTPNDLRAVIRGVYITSVDKKPYEYDPALNELRLSPFHLTPENMDLYLSLLTKYKIEYIQGYPSAMHILSHHILRRNWSGRHNIKGYFPISEKLLPQQRELILKALPDVIITGDYGMSERVAQAFEVIGKPDTYEFLAIYGITELLNKQNQPITMIGDRGRIIGTGFLSTSMPLIRYDTEDEAELVELPSKANRYKLTVKNISSRWAQEFLIGQNNEKISMTAVNIHSTVYSKIREFQLYQETPGFVTVKMIPIPNVTKDELQPFADELTKKIGKSLTINIQIVQDLAQNTRGKRKFIDQRLNLEDY